MNMNGQKRVTTATAGLILFFILLGSSWAATIEAITKPSADVDLSFVQPGRILEVTTKEGES